MPELPEVETVRRSIAPLLEGKRLLALRTLDPLVAVSPQSAYEALVGMTVREVARRGKYLLWRMAEGPLLVVHLRMTGRFCTAPFEAPLHQHDRVLLTVAGMEEELRYRDPRRFGKFTVALDGDESSISGLRALGPEPLELGREDFLAVFQGRRGMAKNALLRQDLLAGIGNIYADESLFQARIHPQQDLSKLSRKKLLDLHAAIQEILAAAIQSKGSTISDFSDALGLAGDYQKIHLVYGKAGQPCPVCGRPLKRMVAAGRGTTSCSHCQPRRS